MAVSDANAAIAFYKAAFGAALPWHLDADRHIVAGLAIDDAELFLGHESQPHGMRSPAPVHVTTKRMRQGAIVEAFGQMWLVGKVLE